MRRWLSGRGADNTDDERPSAAGKEEVNDMQGIINFYKEHGIEGDCNGLILYRKKCHTTGA